MRALVEHVIVSALFAGAAALALYFFKDIKEPFVLGFFAVIIGGAYLLAAVLFLLFKGLPVVDITPESIALEWRKKREELRWDHMAGFESKHMGTEWEFHPTDKMERPITLKIEGLPGDDADLLEEMIKEALEIHGLVKLEEG